MAGAVYSGISTFAHSCSNYGNTFSNNLVHSVDGNGFILIPDPSKSDHSSCFEASNFTAYKNREAGIISFFESKEIRITTATLIDNGASLNILLASPDDY